MSIDIERLKWDAAYWDEVAPEGATHAIPKRGYSATGVAWFKRLGKCDWRVWSRYDSGSFLRWCDSAGTSDGPHFIPRPKPQSSEWDVVEAELHEGEGCWYEAVVIGETIDGRRKVVQWVDDAMSTNSVDALPPNRIRPISTQVEREREELVSILSGNWLNSDMDQLAEAILAWMKERTND